ncbi:hypothetical protein XYCOK13_40840 [Xylanibacillus composti]|uniref:Polysaccharide biosynthesis protein CapD-like domain-containing protein n=2 Tax=Xylanibacillus composti TaxID=1572762 RepID=A0A8J4H7G7_9BACL|nr:polysaccharide biosynthesis protein [Xylanibacillus composti]GIQ71260.1 hypothetical protein XYCOK13_40840 [Xylanibacillus composti]
MGKPVKIADLAHDLIRLSGLEPGKDIQIEFTGMRPGEKLYEELLTNEEGAVATKHDRIFVGRSSDLNQNKLNNQLRKIELLVNNTSGRYSVDIRSLLKDIVPSYQHDIDKSEVDRKQLLEKIKASMEIVATLEEKID